jgi:signal transduction histidine kinase
MRQRLKGFKAEPTCGNLKGQTVEMSEINEATRDLLDIIRFTESLSAKIADVSDEDALYGVLNAEFERSPYSSSIMLLTDDGSELRYAMIVLQGIGLETMERITGLTIRDFRVKLTRSGLFRQIVLEGKTVYAPANEIVEALLPQTLAPVVSKIPGIGKRMTVLTPLHRHGNVFGVFTMSSAELAEEFTPSVMSLARHIASAMRRVEDVTERRKLEAKLERHTEHLEELVKERTEELRDAERLAAIGQVAGAVGHDLRSPLQVVVNELYSVKTKLASLPVSQQKVAIEEGFTRAIGRIEEQVEYMSGIISDLQEVGRPVRPQLAETDLLAVMKGALYSTIVPRTVTVSIKGGDEPDFPKPMADAAMLKRVFVNMINNAVQAMPHGGGLVIGISKAPGGVAVSFRDTGVGISTGDMTSIFHPLFTTKAKGQGLGLSACGRIVEAHGGSITVESQVGLGTTFTVRVPLGK